MTFQSPPFSCRPITSRRTIMLRASLVVAMMLASATLAAAQLRQSGTVAGSSTVSLPYIKSDAKGNQWMVYAQGMVRMQGGSPVFSQAGQLMVNNIQPTQSNNTAQIDSKTGELILQDMRAGTITVTRRLLFMPKTASVRFVDVFTNPTATAQTVNLRWTSYLNFGVQSASFVTDPKHANQNLAWVATTGNNEVGFVWIAAPGAKKAPTLQWTPNQPYVHATLPLSIPAGGKVAVVQVDGVADSTDAAKKWITDIKPHMLLSDLPRDIRKLIVNVPQQSSGLASNIDLLRGNLLDVVQLRNGDRIVGDISAQSFAVHSAFGAVDLPANQLLGEVSAGSEPLWVMMDGQILAGAVNAPALVFSPAGGGAMSIDWSQIAKVGFRHRVDESSESTDEVPMVAAPGVALLAGDRLKLSLSTDAIDFLTRYGPMHIPVTDIQTIAFNDSHAPVDVITLTDGSHFAGLTTARDFSGTAPILGKTAKPITIDISKIQLLELHNLPDDGAPTNVPTLQTTTGNSFTATLQHPVSLQTPAGLVTLDASVISSATTPSSSDGNQNLMEFTTADGSAITGRCADADWPIRTSTGLDISIPVNEIKSYTNADAAVSSMSQAGLNPWIKQLNADDWKQRNSAEHELMKLGPAVAPALRQARGKQTPEAQQRIDSILKQLASNAAPSAMPTAYEWGNK